MEDIILENVDGNNTDTVTTENLVGTPIEPQISEIKQDNEGNEDKQLQIDQIEQEDQNKKPNEKHQYSTRSKDKKQQESLINKSQLKQQQYNVKVQSRLKPIPFKQLDLFNKGPIEPSIFPINEIQGIKFYQSDDHPFNKRGFKYKPCRPNSKFPSNLYSTTEIPPFKIRPSYFDRSNGITFNEDLNCVSTKEGWRSVRSNIGIREGKYYFEFNIINANNSIDKSHVRIGIGRKEASLEAPVGFDGYSYGLRDINGAKMTLSRPKEFMTLKNNKDDEDDEGKKRKKDDNESIDDDNDDNNNNIGFTNNDVIGFLVDLPNLKDHKIAVDNFIKNLKQKLKNHETPRKKQKKNDHVDEDDEKFNKFNNIVRDQIPIKYKNALYYEQFEYTSTKQMDHLLNPVTVFGEKAVLESSKNLIDSSKNLPIIPNSKITVFKNGIEIGTMFENLYSFLPVKFDDEKLDEIIHNTTQQQNSNYKNTDDGSLGYYPMLSVFLNGVVGLNPGPDFKFAPTNEENVKPLSDRYNESIVEEWLWDLIDEVEVEYLDSFDI